MKRHNANVTIDEVGTPGKYEKLLNHYDYSLNLADLYDNLVEKGLDATIINSVFDRVTSDHSFKFDEGSLFFESQLTQFSS